MNNLEIQGDVALRKSVLPTGVKVEVEDKVLAWGEISGHAHTITGDAEVVEIEGKMYVAVGSDGAKLEHMKFETKAKADHQPITLEPNQCYEVLLQNEYNPYEGVLQRVVD